MSTCNIESLIFSNKSYVCTSINLISLRNSSDYGTNIKELLFIIQAICAAQFLPLVLQNLQPSHY